MQILKDSNAIAAELKFDKNEIWTLCVAYVGEGSLNILPKERINKIIFNPNPRATNPNVLKKIGLDKIFFCNNLHVKIYLAENRAIVGSANFSGNGLGEKGTHEIAILTSQKEHLSQLREIVNSYEEISWSPRKNELTEMVLKFNEIVRQSSTHISTNVSRKKLSEIEKYKTAMEFSKDISKEMEKKLKISFRIHPDGKRLFAPTGKMGIIFKIGLSQPSTYIEIQLEKKDPQFNKIIFEEMNDPAPRGGLSAAE